MTLAESLTPARDPASYVTFAYRPDIDGLRAVAVLAVVFFHAGLSCPGGFVGVDIFFVISGYLITALILKELQAGTFTLAGFWERRVRRIFPACAVTVLVTLLAGAFLPSAEDYAKLGWSALAQSVMAANLFFWRQPIGYFAETEFHPLLHTWSLAVEEQFYVFFPVVLLLVWRRRPGRLVALRRGMWIIFGLSLAFAVILLPWKERTVFYTLPTRAWELLVGALLAINPLASIASPRWFRELIAWLGLAGILVPIWLYSSETLFPGLAALPPCVGTAAIIWANTQAVHDRRAKTAMPTWAGCLLANPAFVFLGLISYSFYLWHWPVIALLSYGVVPSALTLSVKVLSISVALALALASWRWVETPFRKRRFAASRGAIFAFSAAVTMMTFAAAGTIVLSRGWQSRQSEVAKGNDAALKDKGFTGGVSTADIRIGRVRRIGPEGGGPPKVLLWGDSHAQHAADALDALAREKGVSVEMIAAAGSPPLVHGYFDKEDGRAEAILQRIRTQGIKDVVLAAYWSSLARKAGEQRLESDLRETILRLAEEGCRVWVLQDVPSLDVVPARAINARLFGTAWGPRGEWRQTPERHRRENAVLERLAAQGLPAVFLDPAASLLESDGTHYRADHEGVSLYFDDDHLTSRGSIIVLLPLLREALGKAWALKMPGNRTQAIDMIR
jgi:peptidoglycan/LPS O-acetylase OafA/YrhL